MNIVWWYRLWVGAIFACELSEYDVQAINFWKLIRFDRMMFGVLVPYSFWDVQGLAGNEEMFKKTDDDLVSKPVYTSWNWDIFIVRDNCI